MSFFHKCFDKELKGVYWYNISGDEIYDGYLISSKPGVGIKLGRYLDNNITWKRNWSLCNEKHIKFNKRLGFEVKDTGKINDLMNCIDEKTEEVYEEVKEMYNKIQGV